MNQKTFSTISQIVPLICVHDAAKLLGISRSKLYMMVENRKIPHVRIDGRVLFQENLLEQWIQEQVVQPRVVT